MGALAPKVMGMKLYMCCEEWMTKKGRQTIYQKNPLVSRNLTDSFLRFCFTMNAEMLHSKSLTNFIDDKLYLKTVLKINWIRKLWQEAVLEPCKSMPKGCGL